MHLNHWRIKTAIRQIIRNTPNTSTAVSTSKLDISNALSKISRQTLWSFVIRDVFYIFDKGSNVFLYVLSVNIILNIICPLLFVILMILYNFEHNLSIIICNLIVILFNFEHNLPTIICSLIVIFFIFSLFQNIY